MDWLIKIFTREEHIAGLEISESYIRIALLEDGIGDKKVEKKSDIRIKFLAEEPLTKGTVVGNSIKDRDKFVKSLGKLIGRSPIKIKFVMVSIPANDIYSKIFSFPKALSGEKLKESMDLTIGFQLPDKPDTTYAGWEKVGLSDQNEVLLATVPRKPINELVGVLASAGLKVVAIEFNVLSICRAMDIKDTDTVLIKDKQASGVTVFIVKNRLPYFVRVLPEQFLSSEDELNEELGRIEDFFKTERGDIDRSADIREVKILDKFSSNPEVSKDNSRWMASIGMAMRALIPRSADDMISLMSIGTEDAYEYQKAVTFSEFILHSAIAISMFFVAALLVTMVSLSSAQPAITKNLSSTTETAQTSTDTEQLQNQAQALNDTLVVTTGILKSTVDWRTVLQKINADLIPGITVNSISMPSVNGTIAINGTATNRDILNKFSATLGADTFFSNVVVPITNVDQYANLPFNATLDIANPQTLYYAQ